MSTTSNDDLMNRQIRQSLADRRSPLAKAIAARHAARIVERLRRAYLGADPTATGQDFDRDLPELREAIRRQAASDVGRHRD